MLLLGALYLGGLHAAHDHEASAEDTCAICATAVSTALIPACTDVLSSKHESRTILPVFSLEIPRECRSGTSDGRAPPAFA